MENNKNKKSVKFQGDMLNFCDFIQVFVFTRNHHLKVLRMVNIWQKYQKRGITERKRAKIENPYLNAYLHINMNSHI